MESQSEGTNPLPVASEPAPSPARVVEPTPSAPVERRGNIPADAEARRKRQALELQRELILSQRTSSPHRRSALEAALIDIEEKLAELGWSIHL